MIDRLKCTVTAASELSACLLVPCIGGKGDTELSCSGHSPTPKSAPRANKGKQAKRHLSCLPVACTAVPGWKIPSDCSILSMDLIAPVPLHFTHGVEIWQLHFLLRCYCVDLG